MSDTDLLEEIEQFLTQTHLAETAFGKLAVNDGKFVRDLKSGRRVWPETAQKVRAFIHDYQNSPQPTSESITPPHRAAS